MSNELTAAAVEYAVDRVVFPVAIFDGDKRPLVKWGQLDQLGPEHRVALARSWWRRWPDALIGMQTGAGLVVIDIDPRHGGTIDPAWPVTRTACTRSGGTHLYYRANQAVGNSVGRLAPGVDVRGERGFVVVPPSPGYTWLNDEPIAELPELVYHETRRDTRCRGSRFEPQEYMGEGGRNDYLARYAGSLWALGYAENDIEDDLLAHNSAVCHPPLDDTEVLAVAASIARYHR